MLNTEKRHYHLVGQTKILGAQSADPKVRSAYIGKKAATLEKCQEEELMLPEDVEKMNLSVFRAPMARCACRTTSSRASSRKRLQRSRRTSAC